MRVRFPLSAKSFLFILIILFSLFNFKIIFSNELLSLKENLKIILSNDNIDKYFTHTNFFLYSNINTYFRKMPENLVKTGERDFEWYKNHFGLDYKVKLCIKFISNNHKLLNDIESSLKVDYCVILAILAMESNLFDKKFIGKFFTFNVLVSQYLFMEDRKKYALNELISLIKFTKDNNLNINNIKGSFAGAIGWAQFIPTSLLNYYKDFNSNGIKLYEKEDTLYSIGYYLKSNGYISYTEATEEEIKKAIFAYNRSDAYVNATYYIYLKLKSYKI